MREKHRPTISAVVAAYQSEPYIAEALDSILGQTLPPDEVVVVDDGSTDGTARILNSYSDQIRVLRQRNAGYPTAMNRAIREAKCEFVAPCGADDVWEPQKLEWQAEATRTHPEVSVFFGHAVFFGRVVGDHPRPTGTGLLDGQALARDLFPTCVINTPSALFGRELFDRLGWFVDGFLGDDYDFFFRCLRAEIKFYYEPRALVRYRKHENNITNDNHQLRLACTRVRLQNADLVNDRRLVDNVLAPDLFKIGRKLVDEGRPREAKQAFRRSLRSARGNTASVNVRALVWTAILGLPAGARERSAEMLVGLSRGLDNAHTDRSPVS